MTNLLIKCPACNKDLGISAEKCMHCGTGNPKIVAQRESSKKNQTYRTWICCFDRNLLLC